MQQAADYESCALTFCMSMLKSPGWTFSRLSATAATPCLTANSATKSSSIFVYHCVLPFCNLRHYSQWSSVPRRQEEESRRMTAVTQLRERAMPEHCCK